ncbi:helix-turn-helix domain-containing protein, partial [Virgibacillus halodenitrificans]|nr:helix-turn-helix domain-containing protein [Virgibacillus halodenitrificans]
MLAKKAYKFRIYPTKKQMELINKTIGCSRFVYNYFVGKQKSKDAYWHIANEMVQNGQLTENNWKGEFFNKNQSIKAVRELKKH